MPNIGPLEIAVVLIIVLIIFGPKRLPELGQSMGRGIREFRNSISGDKDKDDPDKQRKELEASQAPADESATKQSAESAETEAVTENKA
jgi:sec-independent protein translocase protein TatA